MRQLNPRLWLIALTLDGTVYSRLFAVTKPLRNLDDSRIISPLAREGALSPVKGLLRLELGDEAVANPQHKSQ